MSEELPPLTKAANSAPEAPAVIDGRATITYAQFRDAVATTTLPSAQYAIFPAPPSIQSIIKISACLHSHRVPEVPGALRLGPVACPINPNLPQNAVQRLLNKLGPNATLVNHHTHAPAARHITFDPIPHDTPAVIIATSGSTAEPKLALLSYGNLYHSARAANQNIPLHPGDRWLLTLPLYHVAGLGVLFRCLLSGAAIVIPDTQHQIAETIIKHNVTHISLVSTQLYRLMHDSRGLEALRKLKAILLGGGPVPKPLIERAIEHHLPIHTSYGLTETASQITATCPGAPPEALFTSGAPLADDTVAVSPDGEILVRGQSLFQGYLQNGHFERPLTPDGWFQTGDLGRLDSNGRLTVLGRKDSMFISAGENIYPEEIERALEAIPGILQALVIPIEDKERGHIPVAYLRMEPNQIILADHLAAHLSKELPRYKIPRQFHPWPPHLADAAKVNRRSVRK